jgi:hypothetical protein
MSGGPPFVPAVVFNYAAWVARFPEFANVSQPLAQLYFDEAALFVSNTGRHQRVRIWVLPYLLNLMTAHLAWLYAPRDANGNPSSSGENAPMVVGQMTAATEGSVNISTAPQSFDTAEWFAQTKYGFEFWQATAPARTFRYIPHKRHVASGIFPSGLGRWWGF